LRSGFRNVAGSRILAISKDLMNYHFRGAEVRSWQAAVTRKPDCPSK
jgi:hypothetical protein